jgi:hypothetical protein
MAYSNDDVDNTYENLVANAPSDIPVWNAGSVYFDDEVVEYQGRYYLALKKTSAEVPGRSNKWKELIPNESNEETSEMDLSLYGERPKETRKKQTVSPTLKKVIPPLQKKAPIKPVPPQKAVNKPLNSKKTVQERQNESIQKAKVNPVIRKMQAVPTDQAIVNDILKTIEFKKIKGTNADEFSVLSNLILPQKMGEDVQLIWESSHPDVISTQGEVHQPENGVDIAVNLSVTVSKKSVTSKRFFTLWVKAKERVYSDEECVDIVYDMLDFDQIKGENEKLTEILYSLELLTHGLYETEILWASKEREFLDESGRFFQEKLSKNTRIRIYAIIIKGNIQRLKHFELTLKTA